MEGDQKKPVEGDRPLLKYALTSSVDHVEQDQVQWLVSFLLVLLLPHFDESWPVVEHYY